MTYLDRFTRRLVRGDDGEHRDRGPGFTHHEQDGCVPSTQAERDRLDAAAKRCPYCGELPSGGHRLVNGTDCPALVSGLSRWEVREQWDEQQERMERIERGES